MEKLRVTFYRQFHNSKLKMTWLQINRHINKHINKSASNTFSGEWISFRKIFTTSLFSFNPQHLTPLIPFFVFSSFSTFLIDHVDFTGWKCDMRIIHSPFSNTLFPILSSLSVEIQVSLTTLKYMWILIQISTNNRGNVTRRVSERKYVANTSHI